MHLCYRYRIESFTVDNTSKTELNYSECALMCVELWILDLFGAHVTVRMCVRGDVRHALSAWTRGSVAHM